MAYDIDPTKTRQPNSDRLKVLYDALKEDGADVGDSWQFRDWMMADENNRKTVWQAFKDDGADVGEYDEFDTWLYDLGQQPTAATQQPTVQQPTQRNMGTPGYVPNRFGIPTQQQGVTPMQGVAQPTPHPQSSRQYDYRPMQGSGSVQTPAAEQPAYKPQAAPKPQQPTYQQAQQQQPTYNTQAETPVAPEFRNTQKMYSDAADKAWLKAEQDTKALREANTKKIEDIYNDEHSTMLGKMAMAQTRAAALPIEGMAASLKAHDMEKMADDAWGYVSDEDKEYLLDGFMREIMREAARSGGSGGTMSQEEAEKALREEAERRAKARQYQAMYDKAVAANAPKDVLDFLLRKIVEGNSLSKLAIAAARTIAGTRGDMDAIAVATHDYGKGHRVADITGSVLQIATDPVTWASGGIGKAATKGVTMLAGKAIQGASTLKRADMIARALPLSQRMIGGSANFAAFEGLGNIVEQLHQGGVYNEETGQYEYSLKDVAKAAGHGVLLGGATGVVGGLVGNVGDKVFDRVASTAGKLAVRGGQTITSIAAEGTIFAAPELISGEGDFDTWLESVELMAGFKLHHGLKALPGTMGRLMRVPESRAGFETRLRDLLQGRPDLALTNDEREELERGGYTDLSELAEAYKGIEGKLVRMGDEMPYDRFSQLMADNSISEAARAKMYYYVTGRGMVQSTVTAAEIAEHRDHEGNITDYVVKSYNKDGGVITSRTYKSKKAAEVEFGRLTRQSELNSIDMLEKLYDRLPGTDATTAKMLRDVIGRESGIDIDKVIGKEENRRTDEEKAALQEYLNTMARECQDAWDRQHVDVNQQRLQPDWQEAYDMGYNADEQQRSDISIEREDNPNDPQAQAAWQGVEDRIRQDAADRADQRRAEGERMAYKGKGDMQGMLRPLTINEESSERDPQTGERKKKTVYLVNGTIAIEPNGNGLSREGTDKTIYVYDPETGDTHELDPFGGAGVLEVGDVVSMEDYLAQNEQQSQAEVQQAAETAQGKVKVNTHFITPQGRKGVVQTIEGDNAIVLFADGEMEQASMPLAEVQQYADALRRQEYEARHPQETPAEQPQQPITAAEGQAPTATAETPTEGGNAAEDTRTPAQRTYDDMTAKYGEKASHKVDVTLKDRKATLDTKKKALDEAQTKYDDAPVGKEDKAEAELKKAKAEYDNALADYNAWDEVRKLRDLALLAQAEQEEQQRKAEQERKRAAETEAQRKQREAYEAEQARRKAQAEEIERRRQEENARLRAEEEEYAEIKAYLDGHPNASQAELMRALGLGMNRALLGRQRWEKERATQGATAQDTAPTAQETAQDETPAGGQSEEAESTETDLSATEIEERFGLKAPTTSEEFLSNIDKILKQYADRKMASHMVFYYQVGYPQYQQALADKVGATTFEGLQKWCANRQTHLRRGVDKERREKAAELAVYNILNQALQASAEMDERLEQQTAQEQPKQEPKAGKKTIEQLNEEARQKDLKDTVEKIKKCKTVYSPQYRERKRRLDNLMMYFVQSAEAREEARREIAAFVEDLKRKNPWLTNEVIENGKQGATREEDGLVSLVADLQGSLKRYSEENIARGRESDREADAINAILDGLYRENPVDELIRNADERVLKGVREAYSNTGDTDGSGRRRMEEMIDKELERRKRREGEKAEDGEGQPKSAAAAPKERERIDGLVGALVDKAAAYDKVVRNGQGLGKEEYRKAEDDAADEVATARGELRDVLWSAPADVVEQLLSHGEKEVREVARLESERREEEAVKRDFFVKGMERQGTVSARHKAVRLAPDRYTAGKKDQRVLMQGMYHDPEGYGVVTDAHVMYWDRRLYDKKHAGETVATHDVTLPGERGVTPKGGVIEGSFPKWRSAIPQPDGRAETDFGRLLDFLAGVEQRMSERWKSEGKKGTLAKYMEDEIVMLRLPNGEFYFMKYSNLRRFAEGAVNLGATEMRYDYDSRPLLAEGEQGGVLAMPLLVDLEKKQHTGGLNWFYDFSSGAKKQKAAQPRAAALTERERELRDALVETLRGAGIEVVTDEAEGQRVLEMAEGVTLNKAQKRALKTVSISDNQKHRRTVVSSADGAKIQKNLDTLAEKIEKITQTPLRTFIGDLAKALNAEREGSGSEYAFFTTPNGEDVTIRLANHNATVSNFDHRDEDNGISIVIAKRRDGNKGIKNDGKAHVVEYYYTETDLRKAFGKPLADIVRSIKGSLTSGEFVDTTGLAEREEVNAEDVRMHRVYHGSGADFEAFDHSHMGEGEGAQAFGWGTYVTEVEGIGRGYAGAAATDTYSYDGKTSDQIYDGTKGRAVTDAEWAAIKVLGAMEAGNTAEEAIATLREDFAEYPEVSERFEKGLKGLDVSKFNMDTQRILYTVEIPDDSGSNYLDWSGSLRRGEAGRIKDALAERRWDEMSDREREAWGDKENYRESLDERIKESDDGRFVYDYLSDACGSEKAASEFLHSLGYTGIKYQANYYGGGNERGERNYVVFDEKDLRITDKVRFFRTENGEAYGFTMGGKIYLDPKIATAETPIHEYTHLWAEALRQANPKAWERLKEAMKSDTELWAWVKGKYPEIEDEDALAEEVFAHYSGRRGAERLRAEQERMEGETRSLVGKAKVIAMFERLRNVLRDFWNRSRQLFAGRAKGVEKLGAEDFADMALADLLSGVNPRGETRKQEADRHKAAQLRAVVAANAMEDAYHTGIREIDDIKTFEEAVAEGEGIDAYPDFTEADARHAMERGRITVYSSKPIENGTFVTPSKRNAQDYAGGGKVYSMEVPTEDVAWLDANEGQYAKVETERGRDDIRFERGGESFAERQRRAVEERGSVAPGLNGLEVTMVEVPRHGFTGTGKQAITKAKEWSKDNLVGKYTAHKGSTNEFEYRIDEDAVGKFLSSSSTTNSDNLGVHLAVLTKLPDVIDNSIDAEVHPDYKKVNGERKAENGVDNNKLLVHRLYGAVEIDGNVYRVKTTMHEHFSDGNVPHDYKVTKIELLISGSSTSNALSNSISAAKLLKNVEKSYDKGKKLLDESGSRLEESGVRFRGEEEPVFYSNALRAVENIKQEKATPEQWVKMIEKQGGLKAGEDKWIGLSEWLKGSDAKTLTKGEVLDYIRANEIQVEEVEYSGARMPNDFAYNLRRELEEKASEICYDVTDEYADEISKVEDFSDELDEIEEETINEARRRLDEEFGVSTEHYISIQFETDRMRLVYEPTGSDRDFSNNFAQKVWNQRNENEDEPINETRLLYTTKGLDNKREIVLTMPTIEPWNEYDEVHFGEAGGGRAVAWVRFGETVDADGKRVLVIDEIQSNRHQEGREKGYKKDGAQDAVTKANMKRIDAQASYDLYVSRLANKYVCERADIYSYANDAEIAQAEEYKKAVENAEEAYEKAYQENNGVPDAPFEKNWHEVAMKRMLRFAAENGYDKVAWTKGEQQAERYNIGNIVSGIDAIPFKSGVEDGIDYDGTQILIYTNNETLDLDVDSNGVIVKGHEQASYEYEGKNLSDVVGEEVAQKLLTGKEEKLRGNDFRIGGEGMKGFYDQILPRFMDKYGKKWGVKTGEVELPNIGDSGLTMWSVDVTDDMRESVMRGQPLFRPKTQSREGGEEAYAGEWYDRNSVERIGEFAGYSPKQIAKMLARQEESARRQFKETAEKLHLGDRITFVDTIDEIEGIDERTREARRRKKGWFDPRTGKIVIILGNHRSMDDVMKSIMHEGVAHYGLRQMFGEHFDRFLDNVYESASAEIRARIVEMAKRHGWNVRTATEEYLATLAEDTEFEKPENQSWWRQVKAWFIDLLHKIGFKLHDTYDTITDNELRYILWRSYENLVHPGRMRSIVEEAKGIAKQYDLKVGEWDETWTVAADAEPNATMEWNGIRIPVWAGNGRRGREDRSDRFDRGDRFDREDRSMAADGVLFRDGEEEETGAPKAQAAGAYERMVSNGWNQWKEAQQDSMLSLKKLYQAVSEAYKGSTKGVYRIEDEKGYENAYLAENRMHSMSEAQIHAYQQDYMRPLQRAIHALTGGKREAYETLTDYMMAKHGLERNEVMAKREAKKAWEEKYKSEQGNPNYTATKNAVFANIDAGVDDLYLEYRKQDYAGLTALTGIEDVKEAEKEAQRIVDEYEQQHDTTDLWIATNRATRRSLFKMLESGLLSPERHAEIRDMYQYYIPLQGFDSDVAEDVYAYMGSDGTAMYGTTIRAAKGRKSKADDPIATIAMNGEAAIRRGNRNLMKQHFLRFVQSHPSDLVSINDVWLRKNSNGEWEQYFDADLKETDTPEEVARKVRDFNERMEQEAAANPDIYKRSRDLPNVPFRVLNVRDMKQHQVMVQVDGKNYLLTVNGNPRAAQALNGLTNPDVFTGGVIGTMMNATQSVVRTLSQLYTTRNPDFVLSNFLRDAVYTNSMVLAKESPNYALNFHKNFLLLPNGRMGVLFASWESGKLREKMANGTASKMEKMFYDFMMNGGETGWTSLRDIEKHKRDLQKALQREGNVAASALKKLGDFFDITNRMIENHARFTAYVTSIEMGRSVERAVWDAKEISVNFNKKGAGDKFLKAKNQTFVGKVGAFVSGLGRGNYAFWNASLQGLNNIARIGKRNPAKFMAVVTPLLGLGVAIPLLNALLGGDDDDDKNAYWNLPEYVRRSNICFRFTKDMPWITIPLPIEFRAVYGLGELGSGVALGKEHYSNSDLAKQVAAQFSQVLPLDFMEGGGGWHCLYPTYIKPVIEAYSNKSWTGLPIYRRNTYGQYDVAPEWQRAYSNTNNQIMAATQWLNEATGGDEVQSGVIDLNPARIEYMLRGYLGGYFTVADQVIKMGETATGNREFEWRNMMLANRVVKEVDERTEARKLTNEYFNLEKEYDKTDKSLKAYKKKQDEGTLSVVGQAHYIALMNDSEEYGRYLVFGTYKPLFDAYYKQIKEANAAGDSEEAKRLERGQNELRREMVNIIHDMDNGGTFDRKKVATGINENLKKMQNDKLWDAQDKAIDKSIEADNALNPTDNVEE